MEQLISYFNLYMLCDDHSSDAYYMYNHVLNTIHCIVSIIMLMLGGDFNTALDREKKHPAVH